MDRFPNYINATVTQATADAFATLPINVPRQTIAGGFVVKELLYVDAFVDTIFNAANERIAMEVTQGTAPAAALTLSDTRTISAVAVEFSLATTGGSHFVMPLRYNLQSQDGFGFLFAGEQLHFNIISAGTGLSNVVSFRVAYRDVRVTTEELNGLIISLLGS